eukprot:6978668-Heterocapsa_arctica.AAC.1
MAGSSADGRAAVYYSIRLGKDNQGDITAEARNDVRQEMNISQQKNGYLFHWFRVQVEQRRYATGLNNIGEIIQATYIRAKGIILPANQPKGAPDYADTQQLCLRLWKFT